MPRPTSWVRTARARAQRRCLRVLDEAADASRRTGRAPARYRRGELACPAAQPRQRDRACAASPPWTSAPRTRSIPVASTARCSSPSGRQPPGDYVCSGTVVSSNSRTRSRGPPGIASTAPSSAAASPRGWTFIPGYRNGERPFGGWPASELFTTQRVERDVEQPPRPRRRPARPRRPGARDRGRARRPRDRVQPRAHGQE